MEISTGIPTSGVFLSRMTYTYVVTAWNDCNNNGVFDAGVDQESAVSNQAAPAQ